MASITLTIPDADVLRIREALADQLPVVDASEVTIADFKAWLRTTTIQMVKSFELDKAARAAVLTDVDVT